MKIHPFSVVMHTQEFYSFVVRLSLGLCIALYFWIGMSSGDFEVSSNLYFNFATIYFITTLVLGIDLFRNPESTIRRYITLIFDFTYTSYAIFLTGGGESEFMLIYIWLYIAYGTRYGLPYLLSAVLLVMFEYNLLLYLDKSWMNNPLGSSAQIFVLIVMPIYLYSMIKQLHIARKEAVHATRAKSSFLAIMSHEIRTPMSGIVGTAYLLQKTQQSEEQRQYTNTLVNAAKSLHTLIDDILDFSKIEAKKLILKHEAFDLHQIINEVIAVLKPDAEKQSLKLTSSIDPKLPVFFIGDNQRIRQVLFNLVGNAIKFTRQGEVSLNISIIPAEAQLMHHSKQKICLHFDIIDTGVGMSEKQQKDIFNSFTQVDNHQYNTTDTGTGLGTTISKQLVELMGGQIGVSSELNNGSHFWFTLSLSTAKEKDIEINQTVNKLNDSSLNILIVEDEDINAMVLQNFLQNMGHITQRVFNGKSALETLSQSNFDLVFMDMNIPEINGPETTRLWREREDREEEEQIPETKSKHIPIIALTAYATLDSRDICLASGMDDFITKPVSPEQLSSTIEKFCYHQE
ncbi:MAG: response regulator [gamma proteobacterium symbiont of Taylorina sp.]|nr:response regulator [gamma proteobacterium symbiont of Taylorina sp.]